VLVTELSYPSGVLDLQGAQVQMGICKEKPHGAWGWEEMGLLGGRRDPHVLLFLRRGNVWVEREGCQLENGGPASWLFYACPAVLCVRVLV